MKKIISFLILVISCVVFCVTTTAQITYIPTVQSQNNRGKIISVDIIDNETIVRIQFPKDKGRTHAISSATVLVPCDAWNISDVRRSNLQAIPALPSGMDLTQFYIQL